MIDELGAVGGPHFEVGMFESGSHPKLFKGSKGPSKSERKKQQKADKKAAKEQKIMMKMMMRSSGGEISMPAPPPVAAPPPLPPTPAPATENKREVSDAGDDARRQTLRRKGMRKSILAGNTGGANANGKKTLLG